MEFLLAGVFLCTGLGKIFSYNRKAKDSKIGESSGPMGLPYRWTALIGLAETAASLALIAPVGRHPSAPLVLAAALALALLMVAASIYRVRRHESAIPTIVLFLMAVFIIAARSL